MFAVIAENDQSQWSDDTGVLYHFPKRYQEILSPGTHALYYKGRMKDATFINSRLSPDPHYFGLATIGAVYADPASNKGDFFATIEDFQQFTKAVAIKSNDSYFEEIPPNREANYWRDGVRAISETNYSAILEAAGMHQGTPSTSAATPRTPEPATDNDFESNEEGSKTLRYVTTYERDPRYRRQAIAIHGLTCKGCDENMGQKYGSYAEGLIHVHHVVPVSTYDVPKKIDPAKDLVPVCPNCHAVIHRKKTSTISIADVRALLHKGA